MADHGDLAHRLEVAVDSNEKYRSRARAVATLCAAAAGALAAGLILAQAEAVPKPAQVLGLIAITLLIVATAFGVAASSASSYQVGDSALLNFLHFLEVWRIRTVLPGNNSSSPTYEDLIADARAIKTGIGRTLSTGLWSASLAAIVLILCLIVATCLTDSSALVRLELESPPDVAGCPNLGQVFAGEVRERDRTSSAPLLPVTVTASECGTSDGATLYLDKSVVAIVG